MPTEKLAEKIAEKCAGHVSGQYNFVHIFAAIISEGIAPLEEELADFKSTWEHDHELVGKYMADAEAAEAKLALLEKELAEVKRELYGTPLERERDKNREAGESKRLFMWQHPIPHSHCHNYTLESMAGSPLNADFYVRCSKCKTVFSVLDISTTAAPPRQDGGSHE